MASAKDIQKRIKSVTSTHKITRTMEMVATSKFKRAVDRLAAARPFAATLPEMLALVAAGEAESHPLLASRAVVKRVALLVLTTNRGLCGAINTNILRLAVRFAREQEAAGREVDIYVVGKKGTGYLRFVGRKVKYSSTDLSDRPQPEDADRFAGMLSEAFLAGEVDEVHVAYPRFKNAAEQPATLDKVLPLTLPVESNGPQPNFILEPDAEHLLGELLPLFLRSSFFRTLLEMAASEQGARRTAMKAASDSAKEMIDTLTLSYNKARQAQITKELLEIVGGAEALK
ncbi:MAG: ATP synthase F1 subunit gamma [Candidatus Krumholzibacteriia bacterium]|nr:ATP synthase F1 subunit gamma [bacterium]MCB9514222.1 ATP synthase F1 subunit gamma [Candidatus Latescibacterota bacterium]MCB9515891.1 ATP synthase F1 subunit gamma [Candidatus Latescibacterota bacterium]